MALSKRERNLAIAAGVLVVPFAIWVVAGALGGSTKQLRAQKANLVNEINAAKKTIRKGRDAQKRLDDWSLRSLPQDVEAARSRYQIWLMQVCEDERYGARFQKTQVKPMKNQPISGVGSQLGFSVSGEASLEQLIHWLYSFYSSDYLHQIKSLTLTPIEESKKLTIGIQVEALVLNEAADAEGKPRSEELPPLPEDRVDQELLDKYCDTIGDRAIFTRYSPPPPERPAEPPRVEPPSRPLFDHGKFTRVTGITEVDGRPTVWIRLMTSGKDLQLFEGETFEVGPVKAKIVAIEVDGRTVTSEVEGKQYLIALGENLREAKELESEAEELDSEAKELDSEEKEVASEEKEVASEEKEVASEEKEVDSSEEKEVDSSEEGLDSDVKEVGTEEKEIDSSEEKLGSGEKGTSLEQPE